MFKVLSMVGALLGMSYAWAGDGLDQLNAFTNELVSFSATFTQTVYDGNSRPIQESNGSVVLMRPGKFAWHYESPSPQKIIADGKKIWVYDMDLAQVTVKTLDETLSATPIMLLGGDEPLSTQFTIRELGPSDGLQWLELIPKAADTDFETVYMGLNADGLVAMELRDNFGQATQIRFEDIYVNGLVREDAFEFTPPVGVDVIGQ